MASHERWQITLEQTPARTRILKRFRRLHFSGSKISDGEIVAFMAELAFTVPKHLSNVCNYVARYRDAEGGADGLEQLTGTVALSWRKVKA